MEEKLVAVINEMAEVLSIAQLKKAARGNAKAFFNKDYLTANRVK